MPGSAKRQPQAPIDRPLSRAYLREFTGWSTAFPPGVSDPTSLRVMENMQVQRDGSLRIRPGLRYMSYAVAPTPTTPGTPFLQPVVGSHEPFFLNDGTQAYLFAVRENDLSVGFRVLASNGADMVVRSLTDAGIDFSVTGVINFTSQTTYVKYLQIDNKIFALSNAGEPMRYFTVGNEKTAKRLNSVTRPAWAVADKLTVVHPDAAWITSASAMTFRENRITNPNFKRSATGYLTGDVLNIPGSTKLERSTVVAHSDAYSGRLSSTPTRTNLIHNTANNTGLGAWDTGSNVSGLFQDGGGVHGSWGARTGGGNRYVDSDKFDCWPTGSIRVALSFTNAINASHLGVLVRFYNTSGARIGSDVVQTWDATLTRRVTAAIPVPAGTDKCSIHPFASTATAGAAGQFAFTTVVVCRDGESTAPFTGASGANYFWSGTPNNSASTYHPPVDLSLFTSFEAEPGNWTVSLYRTNNGGTARNVNIQLISGAANVPGTPVADTSGWTRQSETINVPVGSTSVSVFITIPAVARGEVHYVDDLLAEIGTSPQPYFDGDSADTTTDTYSWAGTAGESKSVDQTFSVGGSTPPAETATTGTPGTLKSSTKSDNIYNFGFFYTFATEIGESAPSQITTIRVKRPWQAWNWEKPDTAGVPDPAQPTSDPDLCADQLAAYMPQAVYDQAVAQGATMWHLYMMTWSDQDPVPVSAFRVGTREVDPSKPYSANSWLRVTPTMNDAAAALAPLPTKDTRRNYTEPSTGGQGLVASDRMVMVYDPENPAVIRWTSNQQGSYTDFTAGLGGGYKTLTSGNLQIPACVKLWQNPQSVDTLTILCLGTDGNSTGYYMAPAQVASQSEAVNVMGFEETTATPGTTSPYGVEVMNNALYHPIDEMLMKSVASNYNINHSSVTDQIQNQWRALSHKEWIVSSQCDNRIYLLVLNPDGDPLEDDCRGNEVWVFDGQAKAGNWSRWKVQGNSLRKVFQGGRVCMSLTRPDGIYFFDEEYALDDYAISGYAYPPEGGDPVPIFGPVNHRAIPWKFETNTQGANRAHDAPCHLQQANVELGNFQGVLKYGVKGLDIHGKWIDVNKLCYDLEPGIDAQYDRKDFLRVARDIQEWVFYAESVVDEATGVVQPSAGQFDLVQYRYTPLSVNIGGEWGSVETFEYGRGSQPLTNRTTDNGVPQPYIDTARP